jgi:hypothetical protein
MTCDSTESFGPVWYDRHFHSASSYHVLLHYFVKDVTPLAGRMNKSRCSNVNGRHASNRLDLEMAA